MRFTAQHPRAFVAAGSGEIDYYLDPVSDYATIWTPSTGATCAPVVLSAIRDPAVPSTTTYMKGRVYNNPQIFNCEPISEGGLAVKLHVYAMRPTGQGGGLANMTFKIYPNGGGDDTDAQESSTVNVPEDDVWRWYSATFNGPWTAGELSDTDYAVNQWRNTRWVHYTAFYVEVIAPPTSVSLTGAGTTAVNGTYSVAGTADGVDYYEIDGGGYYVYRYDDGGSHIWCVHTNTTTDPWSALYFAWTPDTAAPPEEMFDVGTGDWDPPTLAWGS